MIVYLFELPSRVWRTEIYLIQARGLGRGAWGTWKQLARFPNPLLEVGWGYSVPIPW